MDYFTELLESYSRLKQRKLVLLEKKEKKTKVEKKVESDAKGRDLAIAFFDAAQTGGRNVDTLSKMDAKGAPYAYKAAVSKKDQTIVTKVTGGPLGNRTATAATWDQLESDHEDAAKKLINYFAGDIPDELTAMLQGVGLEAALNRVGNQFKDADPDMDPGIMGLIKGKLATALAKANKVVLTARGLGIKERWAGWDEERQKYVGREEEPNSEDPERTGSVGSYIAGGAGQSVERQMAYGKLGIISEEEGLRLEDMTTDPTLIDGAIDSLNALLSFSEPKITDKEEKCRTISSRVRLKGKKIVLHSRGQSDRGVVLQGNEFLNFAIKQVRERCNNAGIITEIPQGTYTSTQLNDARGKGLEIADAAVGFMDALSKMPDGELKESMSKEFGDYVIRELLLDEKKFNAAHRWAVESERNMDATDLRGSFVRDMLLELGELTSTPEKLVAVLQRAHEMESIVVQTIQSDFTIPLGLKTGAGIVNDVGYLYLDKDGRGEERSTAGADKIGLEEGSAEHVSIADLKKATGKDKTMVELFQKMHNLSDDDKVWMVGSGVKSYLREEPSKGGENNSLERRSSVVHGWVSEKKDATGKTLAGTNQYPNQMAEGFMEVTMDRLGLPHSDIDEIRSYQTELDNIHDTLTDIFPQDKSVVVDGQGNMKPIEFETTIKILEDRINKLSLDDSARERIKALITNQDGTSINLSNDIERLDLRESMGRLLLNAKQGSDSNKTQVVAGETVLTAGAMKARKNLAYTCHMTGGVKIDSGMNKKILETNTVRVGSHMAPINEATKGVLNPDSGFNVSLTTGGYTLQLKDDKGKGINLGTERTRVSKEDRTPKTRTSVYISEASEQAAAKIDQQTKVRKKGEPIGDGSEHQSRGTTPTDIDPRDNPTSDLTANTLQSYIAGQMKLLEELMKQTN